MFQLSIVCPLCRNEFVVVDTLDGERTFRCVACNAVALKCEKIAGFIYILSNELMPGIVKIGFTERTVAERVSELSSHTGVAVPYREEESFPVTDPIMIEKAIHERLWKYRVNQNREFFRLSPNEAAIAVRNILGLTSPTAKSVSEIATSGTLSRSSPSPPAPDSKVRLDGVNLGGFGSSRYERKP